MSQQPLVKGGFDTICPACGENAIYILHTDRFHHTSRPDQQACWDAIDRGDVVASPLQREQVDRCYQDAWSLLYPTRKAARIGSGGD